MAHDPELLERAKSFTTGAEAYDAYRPGYPLDLLDDVLSYAPFTGEATNQQVLEVGAGTGKITLPLAQRGLNVTALEPAEDMARVLRANADREGVSALVTVRVAAFEDLGHDDGPYGLVIAAQSFHWADPDTRWARLVDLLDTDGTAAMFWNGWSLDPGAHDLAGIRDVYRELGPDLTPDLAARGGGSWPGDEIAATARLVDATERSYEWTWNLLVNQYLSLLATTSQYAVLAEPTRAALFDALRGVLGDDVSLLGQTQLNLMRRAR